MRVAALSGGIGMGQVAGCLKCGCLNCSFMGFGRLSVMGVAALRGGTDWGGGAGGCLKGRFWGWLTFSRCVGKVRFSGCVRKKGRVSKGAEEAQFRCNWTKSRAGCCLERGRALVREQVDARTRDPREFTSVYESLGGKSFQEAGHHSSSIVELLYDTEAFVCSQFETGVLARSPARRCRHLAGSMEQFLVVSF